MPSTSMASLSTSAMIVAPGSSERTGSARIIKLVAQITRRFAVHCADPVFPSPVNGEQCQIELLALDELFEVRPFDIRIGMVVREGTINVGEDGEILPGEPVD